MPRKVRISDDKKVYKSKHPGGRPTKFADTTCEQVYKLALLGLTDEEMADFFKISTVTFYDWQNNKPEFAKAVWEGKTLADGEVVHSFYQRCIGYDHAAVKIFNDKHDGIIYAPYIEHTPPDVGGIKNWLANRRRGSKGLNWSERQEITGKDGGPIEIAAIRRVVVDPQPA